MLHLPAYSQQSTEASSPSPIPPPSRVLTRIGAITSLDADEARHADHPARIRAVVTYQPRDLPWVYVHDGDHGVLASLKDRTRRYQAGQQLELEGIVRMGMWAPYIEFARITVTGQAPLPVPKRAEPARGDEPGRGRLPVQAARFRRSAGRHPGPASASARKH